jgi:hypothetical protein
VKRIPTFFIVISMALVLAGCGPDRPDTVRVRGKVTFDGEAPPAPGMVYFAPVEVAQGVPRRPGRGPFDLDGEFTVTSFSEGDGLVPGTYRVRVECWKKAPTMDAPGESYVAAAFHPPTVNVAARAGRLHVPLDVSLAK